MACYCVETVIRAIKGGAECKSVLHTVAALISLKLRKHAAFGLGITVLGVMRWSFPNVILGEGSDRCKFGVHSDGAHSDDLLHARYMARVNDMCINQSVLEVGF